MLGYGVILFVDYEKALCPLFPQYKGGQISLRLLNSPKSEVVLCVKDQRRHNFHSETSSSNGNLFRSAESSKKPFKVCYKCGKPGHFKRDCRVKAVCDRCGKPDHIKPNCRVKMQESEANAIHESKSSSDPIWEHCLTIKILDQPTNVTLAVHQMMSLQMFMSL